MQCSTSAVTIHVQSCQDYLDNAGVVLELTFIQQSTAFLYSIPLGIALGILYGVFKFLRTAFNFGRVTVIATDVLYMILSMLAIFFFSLTFLLGYIRIYVCFGALLGFLFYRLTLGRLFSKLYCPIILFCRKMRQTNLAAVFISTL